VDGVDRTSSRRRGWLTERQIVTVVELPLGLPLSSRGSGPLPFSWWRLRRSRASRRPEAGGLGQIMANPVFYGESGVLAAAIVVAAMAS
jgi:hypothetical protein